jgi:hypothetical protein
MEQEEVVDNTIKILPTVGFHPQDFYFIARYFYLQLFLPVAVMDCINTGIMASPK